MLVLVEFRPDLFEDRIKLFPLILVSLVLGRWNRLYYSQRIVSSEAIFLYNERPLGFQPPQGCIDVLAADTEEGEQPLDRDIGRVD